MYEVFFELSRRPFPAVPQAGQYFAAAAIENARAMLARCIDRGEGVGVAIGPTGTGKTLLCQLLAAAFETKLQTVLLSASHFRSRRALFQAVLYELGRPYRGLDEGEARLALMDFLMSDDECPEGLLLIVDEAHTLPLRMIDELRMLTNVVREGHLQVRLLLVGSCALEERLANPKLESLSQRITARCYLEALQKHETQEYVQTRINLAGGNGPRLFSDVTCHTIHRATDGVPRLINQVCDHAMLLALARGQRAIESALIEEAWADLQQLPTPWNGDKPQPAENCIEFGSLDDDDEARNAPAAQSTEPEASDIAPPRPSLAEAQFESFLEDDEDAAIRAEQGVEQIETMLGEVEEFRPATSGPEVEIVFDEPGHPFAEHFAEEEQVIDRFASRRAARPADAWAAHHDEPETVPLRGDDEPILIIEDGYDHGGAAPACHVAPVRRNELGQLFSRLRRGG